MRQFRMPVLILAALVLTIITFLLTPTVDVIQLGNAWQYPFFYASTLPPTYYLAVIYSALLAVFCRNDYGKLTSLLCVAFLIELTPSLMLVNPWLPDQYPYLAEPVYLIRNSHIAPVHYLHEVPGLGLMFSQLMLTTNLGPCMVSKVYPFLTVLMLVLPTFLLSRELCGNGALAPLLFLAVNSAQINTFHRASFFFMLFSLALFLVWRISRELKPAYVMLFVIAFSTATLTYPGSILIPFTLLSASLIWLILKKFQLTLLPRELRHPLPRSFPTIYRLGLISMIVFLSWNIFISLTEFACIVKQIHGAFIELASPEDPFRILTPQHGFAKVPPTTVFLYILWIRMVLVTALQSLGFLSVILLLHGKRNSRMLMHTLYLPLLATYLLFLPTTFNQWYIIRAVLYATLIAALCAASLWYPKQSGTLKMVIVVFIMAGLTLIPITRYASMPYLHPTTQELKAATFTHYYYVGSQPIYYTEYPPYIRVIVGKDPWWELTGYPPMFEQDFDPSANNFLISRRYLTRDGYYAYTVTREKLINQLISSLSKSHDLVYTSGDFMKMFISVTHQ